MLDARVGDPVAEGARCKNAADHTRFLAKPPSARSHSQVGVVAAAGLLGGTNCEIRPKWITFLREAEWRIPEVANGIGHVEHMLALPEPCGRGGFVSRDDWPAEHRCCGPAAEGFGIGREPAGTDDNVVIGPDHIFAFRGIDGAIARARNSPLLL